MIERNEQTEQAGGEGAPLKGSAIAGRDRQFVWAEARLEGDTVVVSSPSVPNPVAVRYAWADNPEANLYNREGLPASIDRNSLFRSDSIWAGKGSQSQGYGLAQG